jgi:hypothetical protein
VTPFTLPDGLHLIKEYYRKHSIPNGRFGRPRGLFSSRQASQPTQPPQRAASPAPEFARPDLDPSSQSPPRWQSQDSSTSHPRPYVPSRTAPPPTHHPHPRSTAGSVPTPPRLSTARSSASNHSTRASVPSRPAAAAPPPVAPQAPPPTLNELLAMTEDSMAALSISVLKTVLFNNHVNARLLLEKSELVGRVRTLVEDERRERAREAAAREHEEAEAIARQNTMREELRAREEGARTAASKAFGSSASPVDINDGAADGATSVSQLQSSPPLHGFTASASSSLERNGLCVICQDEEANIAIVDCGWVFYDACLLDLLVNDALAVTWLCARAARTLSWLLRASVHSVACASSLKHAYSVYSRRR